MHNGLTNRFIYHKFYNDHAFRYKITHKIFILLIISLISQKISTYYLKFYLSFFTKSFLKSIITIIPHIQALRFLFIFTQYFKGSLLHWRKESQ